MRDGIFRQEALEANADRLSGEPFLQYPLRVSVIVRSATAIVVALVLFCTFFEYTQKETAAGFVEPEGGLLEVFPEHSGVIASALPALGATVRQGDVLAVLSSQPQETDGALLSPLAKDALSQRIASLRSSVSRQSEIAASALRALQEQQASLDRIIGILGSQLANAARQVEIKRALLARGESLARDGYVTSDFIDQRRLELGDAQGKHDELQRELAKARSDRTQVDAALARHRLDSVESRQVLTRELLGAEAAMSERQHASNFQVRAPFDGVVSSVHRHAGQFVRDGSPIVTLMPKGGTLRAILLLPAKAVAFAKVGQHVSIRYSAFPYQYFGSFPGVVKTIETIPFRDANGAAAPAGAATYRVGVELTSQSVETASGVRPLSPGMPIEADIWLARRSLLEWIFTPAYEFFVKSEKSA